MHTAEGGAVIWCSAVIWCRPNPLSTEERHLPLRNKKNGSRHHRRLSKTTQVFMLSGVPKNQFEQTGLCLLELIFQWECAHLKKSIRCKSIIFSEFMFSRQLPPPNNQFRRFVPESSFQHELNILWAGVWKNNQFVPESAELIFWGGELS